MTLLAGLWRFLPQPHAPAIESVVASMLGAWSGRGDGASSPTSNIRADDRIAIGTTGVRSANRQIADLGSVDVASGTLFAADARIDNRPELLDRLGLRTETPLHDEGLMLLAYRQWGDRLVDIVVGDYACAAWSSRDATLTLIRDPVGQRPLHYRFDQETVAFASMPQGLLALAADRSAVNTGRLARFVAGLAEYGPESFLDGIMRVEPAHIVRITRSGVHAERYWRMPTRELRYRNQADYADAFREVLDRATKDRLRDAGSLVASHLSAGLDSGTVTATAARLMADAGGKVLAVTSAPRDGFAGPVPRGRIADESLLAADLAGRYANIEHLIFRSDGLSPLSVLTEDTERFAQPIGYPCNNMWWRRTNAAAQARGATVLLTGEMGNLTISAGGLPVLAEYLRTGRYVQWLREVLALRRTGPRWRGLMAASFGPWIPASTLGRLRRFAAGGQGAVLETLLSHEFREAVETQAARFEANRAGMTEREIRWDMLRSADPGNFRKAAWLTWGIDERDPTADRRLVEFCFALPPAQLLGGGETRRLARTALADRLPPSILNGLRGYQFADWYEAVHREDLVRTAELVAASPTAARVLDIAAIQQMIDTWPPDDWASMKVIGGYRVGLLRALAAGIFALKAEA